MADINSIRVGQLPNEVISLTDKIPHEVGDDLKRATIEDLAIFISNYASTVIGVGFRAVTVLDGQTLPETDKQEFILVGAGTFYNVNGGSTIVLTEELNALISNGEFWNVGVEIPVNIQSVITQSVRNGFTNTSPSEDAIYNYLLSYAKLSDLPSPIKEVVEADDFASLPLIGEIGKIYVTKDLNNIYRWNGTIYQELAVTDISGKINVSEKGVTVATLEGGKIPNSQIPALAISETFPVSSQAQMLALSQADQGDVAIRSDISKSFILRVSPSSILGNWSELLTPASPVTSVNGKVGVVTLVKADVGLSNVDNTSDVNKPVSTATQTALNLKENAFSKNTAFNKNFGTTAGTVVEGGTLGSNAYSSNAYLPLSGGTLTGILNVNKPVLQIVSEGSDQGAIDLLKTGDTRFRLFSDINGFGIYNFQSDVANLLLNKTTGAATFSSSVTATSFNGSATLTGTPTAPTAPAGTNTTQIATTAFVQANGGRPYKVYTAFLSQAGTDAPVATVLENTLGGTVVWSRNAVGDYYGTLNGAFVIGKTISFQGGSLSAPNISMRVLTNSNLNSVRVITNSGSSATDTALGASSIEIRVYN